MGWLQRIFGTRGAASAGGPATSRFYESEPDRGEDSAGSRNTPRRELVQVILRDTMRKHGIPSDWIECRILSAVTRSGRSGLHVNLVVRQAHDQLLGYVFAFQHSFEEELARFEPRSGDWLLSLGWEFKDHKLGGMAMPDPLSWARTGQGGHAPLAAPGSIAPVGSAVDPAFAPTVDLGSLEPTKSEDDIQRDLQALFAIRDAAIAQATGQAPAAPAPREFEPTHPFPDSKPQEKH